MDTISVGDASRPGLRRRDARVAIVDVDGDLEAAAAPDVRQLVLSDDLDISAETSLRRIPARRTQVRRRRVWMDERPLDAKRPYILKQGTRTVMAESGSALALNQIGTGHDHDGAPHRLRALCGQQNDGQLHPDRFPRRISPREPA